LHSLNEDRRPAFSFSRDGDGCASMSGCVKIDLAGDLEGPVLVRTFDVGIKIF
jgi:hypothetical protein